MLSQAGLELQSTVYDEPFSEVELAGFCRISSALLCAMNFEGQAIRFSPSWKRIVGSDLAVIDRDTFLERVHPDDVPVLGECLEVMSRGEEVVGMKTRLIHPTTGVQAWIQWSGRADVETRTIYIKGEDITDLEQARAQLGSLVERYAVIVGGVAEAIVSCDDDGLVDAVNPAAEEMFGYASDELLGRPVTVLMSDDLESKYLSMLREDRLAGLQGLLGAQREVMARRKSGALFPIDMALSESERNGVRRFIAVVRDISERRDEERRKAEFVSIASHELRTPLGSISGSLRLLSDFTEGMLPGEAIEMVEMATRNCDRLLRLVDDILDLEKMSLETHPLRLAKVSTWDLLHEAIGGVVGLAWRDGVEIGIRKKYGAPESLIVDQEKMARVLINLLGNAVRFSPGGGEIHVEVSALSSGGCRLVVADCGPGVPEADRRRIFDKFQQLDAPREQKAAGTGLGLAIARAIVEQHGGRIGVDENPGGGARFWVDLPAGVAEGAVLGS